MQYKIAYVTEACEMETPQYKVLWASPNIDDPIADYNCNWASGVFETDLRAEDLMTGFARCDGVSVYMDENYIPINSHYLPLQNYLSYWRNL